MIAALLTTLFAVSGVLSVLTIRQSWRRYGPALLQTRAQLRACNEWREVTGTLYETAVHPAGATILRPDFKGRERAPAPANGLPAAA